MAGLIGLATQAHSIQNVAEKKGEMITKYSTSKDHQKLNARRENYCLPLYVYVRLLLFTHTKQLKTKTTNGDNRHEKEILLPAGLSQLPATSEP